MLLRFLLEGLSTLPTRLLQRTLRSKMVFLSTFVTVLSPRRVFLSSFRVPLTAKLTQNDRATGFLGELSIFRGFGFRLSVRNKFKILLVTHRL